MDYPVFDLPYQEAYTSTIEFNTQINEKMKGREQRYPVWTYPKRTFTLKFDKSFSKRKLLETFFVQVLGQSGKFWFKWAKEKGGNDKNYLCNFETDTFKQNITDFGFSESELKLVCIDNSSIEDVGDFDFYHKAKSEFAIEFYTLADKIFTAQNEKMSCWDSPKKSWVLTFEKNDKNRKLLENFFVAKRGRFHSFNWTWTKQSGGDGKTYTVRFDSDVLNSDIDTFGFGQLQIRLKEVFPTPNPILETEKDEIIPRKLLKIELDDGSLYILDNETLESLTYDGQNYLGAPLSFDEIKKDDNSSVSKLGIQLSNVGLSVSGIIAQRGDIITSAPAVLTLVFLDVNTNTLLQDTKQVLFAGKCNNLKLDYENATLDIETSLGGYEIQAPAMKYRTTCQVRRFKDCRCCYNGQETECDRTFDRCKELGNEDNFRGFPQMFSELVIKA